MHVDHRVVDEVIHLPNAIVPGPVAAMPLPPMRLRRHLLSDSSRPGSLTSTIEPLSTPMPSPANTDFSPMSTTISVIGGIVIVALILVIFILVRNKRQRNEPDGSNRSTENGFRATDDTVYIDTIERETPDNSKVEPDIFPEAKAFAVIRIPYHRLTIGRLVSQGGFGMVFRGTYEGRDVAIKRLLPSRRRDPRSIRGFIQEIQLTSTLEHECLVQFIGVAWNTQATLCMVTEFMDGGDLRELLKFYANSNRPNGHDDTKLRIAIHVAHALTYLHSLPTPVVHRDLKSKNVLLTKSLDAKLIDFGVSTERQDVTMTAGVGTSLWMAPEVMLGNHYDEKADTFSFGVLLSELDTHDIPYEFARESQSQRLGSIVLLQMIAHGKLKPQFTDKARPEIVALARDCLHLDAKKRPAAAEIVRRIHEMLQTHKDLSERTRAAMNRSLLTVETRASTKYNYTGPHDSMEWNSQYSFPGQHDSMGLGTRATTQYSHTTRREESFESRSDRGVLV